MYCTAGLPGTNIRPASEMKTEDEPDLNEIQRAASEQFARQSHRYGKGHILENVADVEAALEGVPLPAKARVLDVATGGGHTGLHFASLGHEVTLSDLTDAMLERAAELAASRGLSVRTIRHSAEAMPHADGSFDLVTCRVAPHHFSAPDRFVKEVARVLAPGGHFMLIDGSVFEDETEAEEWLHRLEKLRDPSHNRFLAPRQWKGLCAAAGLEVVKCGLHPRKQPDLEWYFETAATPPANREAVHALIAAATGRTRELFKLSVEDGRTVWWWPMVALVARKWV